MRRSVDTRLRAGAVPPDRLRARPHPDLTWLHQCFRVGRLWGQNSIRSSGIWQSLFHGVQQRVDVLTSRRTLKYGSQRSLKCFRTRIGLVIMALPSPRLHKMNRIGLYSVPCIEKWISEIVKRRSDQVERIAKEIFTARIQY